MSKSKQILHLMSYFITYMIEEALTIIFDIFLNLAYDRREESETMKQKDFFRLTVGTLGFLFIIKGISGFVQQATVRPSSAWRSPITVRDLLVSLYICVCVPLLIRFFDQRQSKRWLTVFLLFFIFIIFWLLPLDTETLSLHPMTFFLTGFVLLPALHFSEQKNTE